MAACNIMREQTRNVRIFHVINWNLGSVLAVYVQFADWTVLKEMPLIPPSNRNPQQDPMCHFQTRGRHDTSEKLSNLFDSTVMCIMFFSKGLKRNLIFVLKPIAKKKHLRHFLHVTLNQASRYLREIGFFTSLPINASWSNLLQHLFFGEKKHTFGAPVGAQDSPLSAVSSTCKEMWDKCYGSVSLALITASLRNV